MNASRAVFRGAGWRRALLKVGSYTLPSAASTGRGGGGGGGARRHFAALVANSSHTNNNGGMAVVALGSVSLLLMLSSYHWNDVLPSYSLEEIQQQDSSTAALPLRRLDEFYTVKSDETLGRGQFGTVFTATDKATGEVVAVKCVPRSEASEAHFREEADVHRDVASHPNVVGLKGIYADEDCWYLAMELAKGGELFDRLTTEGVVLEDREVRSLLRDTAEAIAYLHDHSIVHGDVKPENILLTEPITTAAADIGDENCTTSNSRAVSGGRQIAAEQEAKREGGQEGAQGEVASGTGGGSIGKVLLADFGSSFRTRGEGGHNGGHKAAVKEYTVAYSAPEVVENSPAVDQKADVWSLGVIAYVMVVGHHPFDPTSQADDEEIAESILHSEPEWDGVEPKAATLIRRMLSRNPQDRPSAREVLQNSWLQQLQ